MLPSMLDSSGEMRTTIRLSAEASSDLKSSLHLNSFSLITLLVGDELNFNQGDTPFKHWINPSRYLASNNALCLYSIASKRVL